MYHINSNLGATLMRIPQYEYKDSHTITVPPSLWKFAKYLGRGNASAGITYLLERAKIESEKEDLAGNVASEVQVRS
jgi:hypothetical protein